jgi:hypothetical protein
MLFKSNSFKVSVWAHVSSILESLFDHIKKIFSEGINISDFFPQFYEEAVMVSNPRQKLT